MHHLHTAASYLAHRYANAAPSLSRNALLRDGVAAAAAQTAHVLLSTPMELINKKVYLVPSLHHPSRDLKRSPQEHLVAHLLAARKRLNVAALWYRLAPAEVHRVVCTLHVNATLPSKLPKKSAHVAMAARYDAAMNMYYAEGVMKDEMKAEAAAQHKAALAQRVAALAGEPVPAAVPNGCDAYEAHLTAEGLIEDIEELRAHRASAPGSVYYKSITEADMGCALFNKSLLLLPEYSCVDLHLHAQSRDSALHLLKEGSVFSGYIDPLFYSKPPNSTTTFAMHVEQLLATTHNLQLTGETLWILIHPKDHTKLMALAAKWVDTERGRFTPVSGSSTRGQRGERGGRGWARAARRRRALADAPSLCPSLAARAHSPRLPRPSTPTPARRCPRRRTCTRSPCTPRGSSSPRRT